MSGQKWEDRLYENLSQTVERNQQTNQSQPVNGQKMSDCGQKTSESSRIHMDYGETVVLSVRNSKRTCKSGEQRTGRNWRPFISMKI